MALETYKGKRNFERSPEPTGGKPVDKKLHFVIQKHHASHLHYDFRLELRGILKSWAVPKGPSMIAGEKRLAMLVEDHQWDYKDFEGIIPSGYGKGTVIVWDEGSYETTAIKEKDKKSQEHSITSQFWKGQIKLKLQGHKVRGEFTITRAKEKGENAWYLVKVKDKYATEKDITLKDKSVVSKKTLEQVAAAPEREWQSHKPAKDTKIDKNEVFEKVIIAGKKSAFPATIEPMLCTLVAELFTKEGWIYEVKWDGYRILAHKNKKDITLRSRAGKDYSDRYTPVLNAIKKMNGDFVIDGEVVAFDEEGHVNFDLVQKANPNAPLAYYVFDILWKDGYDLMQMPLTERKEILQSVLPKNSIVKFSDSFPDGIALYKQAEKLKIEGIVAKKADSIYQPGNRSKDWLKIPIAKRQEFVIGGWTESGSGRPFRSILFGAYESDKLVWIGHSGSGFKDKVMKEIIEKLKPLEIKKSPFANKVDYETKPHWVKPQLVANFKFSTWTASGKIRKPAIFLDFRYDKKPKEVVREIPLSHTEEEKIIEEKVVEKTTKTIKTSFDSNWREIEKITITSKDEINIDNCTIELTNVERELWDGITKANLIQYYNSISDYILPYLTSRPLSLHVKPYSPTAPGLYIKDMEGRQPSCADIYSTPRKHPKPGKRSVIDYLVCNNKATLLYLINLGCIDINPHNSTVDNYLHPNYIIIDLDPTDDDFNKVIQTALAAKEYFDKKKLKVFPKTSGKTGLHLFIPCEAFTFPEARTIAVNISKQITAMIPDIATSENTISKRGDKMFIDYNQNDEADTVASVYSVRPSKQPTVSTPLDWKEINDKLHPSKFDMHNILDRIKKKGDLWKGVVDEKIKKRNSSILRTLV